MPSESAIRALIDADPRDPFGWYALGIELRRLSRFSEAREAFHASLQRDENQPYAWFQIAQILAEEGQSSPHRKIGERARSYLEISWGRRA